ncbi:hypothetical protein SAMD00019534_080590 [Acytostelium subglobosum LB1]|uniref:hypothetical protein n=1 Tax=Acytostelium subglobosum LB1 TaxID=1410327 RepID=UPI000644F751|nr:hypothetical protein SAMD00019534_080590 [Acytostelium subglobosum LB1]GAM24884.1 hypothetical protein SAMD00019534_080590 [Acytostelium subglobosum LB1]|eukprot:XP_012751973.1 hypothetical protein SAMD00019534_080590 [Acytostelium subglobosum LB1]
MIQTLYDLPVDSLYPSIIHSMMKSALTIHEDIDLCIKVAQRHSRINRPNIEHYLLVSLADPIPVFAIHQTRVINDIRLHLSSLPSRGTDVTAQQIMLFALKNRLFDLVHVVAPHVKDTVSLTPIAQPMTIDMLKTLSSIQRPMLFNRLAAGGDITFMMRVKHLVADYMASPTSAPLFNQYLIQSALTNGHYECAIFILDTFTHLLPQEDKPIADKRWNLAPKWQVLTNVNMLEKSPKDDQSHNWPTLIDLLLSHNKVSCNFNQLYISAIHSKRMDVIEHLEQLMELNPSQTINIQDALVAALDEEFMPAIKSIMRQAPPDYIFEVNLFDLYQFTPDMLVGLLESLPSSCQLSIDTHIAGVEWPACDILKVIERGQHNICGKSFQSALGIQAALLGEYELMLNLIQDHNQIYVTTICKNGADNADIIQYLLNNTDWNKGENSFEDLIIYSLLNFGHGNKIELLLSLPQHMARLDMNGKHAVAGMVLASDVLRMFNLESIGQGGIGVHLVSIGHQAQT